MQGVRWHCDDEDALAPLDPHDTQSTFGFVHTSLTWDGDLPVAPSLVTPRTRPATSRRSARGARGREAIDPLSPRLNDLDQASGLEDSQVTRHGRPRAGETAGDSARGHLASPRVYTEEDLSAGGMGESLEDVLEIFELASGVAGRFGQPSLRPRRSSLALPLSQQAASLSRRAGTRTSACRHAPRTSPPSAPRSPSPREADARCSQHRHPSK